MGLITSLCLKTIIRSKKKKARYTITNVSLKDISNITKKFDKLPYEGYVRKSSKYEPTDSLFYLARQIAKCIMRINSHVGLVRTKMTNTQNMKKSVMCMQKTPNLHVCSIDVSESYIYSTD